MCFLRGNANANHDSHMLFERAAYFDVLNIDSGERDEIKVIVGATRVNIGGISISAVSCKRDRDNLPLDDHRAFVAVYSNVSGRNVFRGWASKRYSLPIIAGRLLLKLNRCG